MPKATRIHDYHQKFPNGERVDIVIWQLPNTTDQRPYGLKYRLNYCTADGFTVIRYDNELGKGDHKHICGKQVPYKFQSIRRLFEDFRADLLKQGVKL